MRIDLPQCGFKSCKFQGDGNCLNQNEHDRCEYARMSGTIRTMIMAFNLCSLCQSTRCQNSRHDEDGCFPIWNGLALGAVDTYSK